MHKQYQQPAHITFSQITDLKLLNDMKHQNLVKRK